MLKVSPQKPTKPAAPGTRSQKTERVWSQLFKLDPGSGVSLQIQIRRAFVASILDKRLPPGAKLPSSRVLSEHLGVARNTVNAAYRQLADDDFIVDRHPEFKNVAFAVGFSGHGFKFAPVIAEALADLVLEGKTVLPVGFLALDRLYS